MLIPFFLNDFGLDLIEPNLEGVEGVLFWPLLKLPVLSVDDEVVMACFSRFASETFSDARFVASELQDCVVDCSELKEEEVVSFCSLNSFIVLHKKILNFTEYTGVKIIGIHFCKGCKGFRLNFRPKNEKKTASIYNLKKEGMFKYFRRKRKKHTYSIILFLIKTLENKFHVLCMRCPKK